MSTDTDFPESELEASLRRAFVERGFDTILMDGHESRNPFLRAAVHYGLENGWLEVRSTVEESQYFATNYGLTEKGKRHFVISR